MYNVTIEQVMSKSNTELYALGLDVFKKLKQDYRAMETWCEAEKKRSWYKKQQPKPELHFPDLGTVVHWFDSVDPALLYKYTKKMETAFESLNSNIVHSDDIEEVPKRYFVNLFNISYKSKDVFNYIIQKYINSHPTDDDLNIYARNISLS